MPRKHLVDSVSPNHAHLDLMSKEKDHVHISKHAQYKYLVDIDGMGASSRFQQLLGMGSTVLKMDSQIIQYYSRLIRPYVEYVPFFHTGDDDLANVTQWLIDHDDVAKSVAEKGRDFALKHLKRGHVLCYWAMLLTEYSKLLNYTPRLEDYPLAGPISAATGKAACQLDRSARPRGGC